MNIQASKKFSGLLRTLAVFVVVSTPLAYAAPIQWVLEDVLFDDGAIAFGSFFYDADTNAFSSIFITTTDGNALGGSVYEFINPDVSADADSVLLVAAEDPIFGTPAFNMNLSMPMTNAGGTIDLALAPPPFAFESTCLLTTCTSFFSIDREIISGSISAVPLPAAFWFMGSALGMLGWLRRN